MKNSLNYSIKYTSSPNFVMREIGSDTILVPVNQIGIFENSMLSLNMTSSFLWKVFQTPHTAAEAIEIVKENFSGDEELIARDVHDFINEFVKYDFLIEKEVL